MKKSKHTRVWIIVAVVLITAATATFISMKMRGKKNESQAVPLAAVKRGILLDRVSAAGSFQAEKYTVVSSHTVGIVKAVHVKPGDGVRKDDVIVEVDEREARESLATAEIAREETRRNLAVELASLRSEIRKAATAADQARRTAESAERLRAVDGISQEDYKKAIEETERARFALADAKDRLRIAQGLPSGTQPILDPENDAEVIASSPTFRRAELAVAGARRVLEGCVIRSEGPGIVTEIGVAVGDRLITESKVARIEELSSVTADVNVDEVDVGKIREGLEAEVTADSLLGRTLKGKIGRIWPIVKNEGNGRVCRVRIVLDLGDEKILSGASCMARITSTVREDALIIPASALIPGAKPPAVWVAVEETASSKEPNSADTKGAGEVAAGSAEVVTASDGGATRAVSETPDSEAVSPANTEDEKAADGKASETGKKDKKKAPPEKLYKAARREIGIGASTVAELEVLSGLEAGELVAVDMVPKITEGMRMRDGSK